jgi:hypothetical protein
MYSFLAADPGSYWEEEEYEISPEDEAALAAFMAPNAANYKQRTLADLIMDKIKEKEAQGGFDAPARCVWLCSCSCTRTRSPSPSCLCMCMRVHVCCLASSSYCVQTRERPPPWC